MGGGSNDDGFTIRIGQEILCLPYAGFFLHHLESAILYNIKIFFCDWMKKNQVRNKSLNYNLIIHPLPKYCFWKFDSQNICCCWCLFAKTIFWVTASLNLFYVLQARLHASKNPCFESSWSSTMLTLRSEQAPGSEFHPRDESEKKIVVFWDLLGAMKR